MELAEGGELLTFVKNNNEHKRLEEAKARPFVRQLISALYYLHSKGIVHRFVHFVTFSEMLIIGYFLILLSGSYRIDHKTNVSRILN